MQRTLARTSRRLIPSPQRCVALATLVVATAAQARDTLAELEATMMAEKVWSAAATCAGVSATATRPPRNAQLDQVARLVQRGQSLEEAMQAARYHALRSSHITVTGWRSTEQIVPAVIDDICRERVRMPDAEWGVYASAPQAVIVAAVPWRAQVEDPIQAQRKVLSLTNEVRARGKQCGPQFFAPARPLARDPRLDAAALTHAIDLARRAQVSHLGSDGREPGQRSRDAGYLWRSVGENLASGYGSPVAVVEAWLNSPEHCATLMSPRFRDMGIAVVVDPDRRPGIYWVQKFGAPR